MLERENDTVMISALFDIGLMGINSVRIQKKK